MDFWEAYDWKFADDVSDASYQCSMGCPNLVSVEGERCDECWPSFNIDEAGRVTEIRS